MTGSCAAASATAGEQLAGTATEAADWLLVEVGGAWGRDAVADTPLPDEVREVLGSFRGRAGLIRRSGRRPGAPLTVLRAEVAEEGGCIVRSELRSLDDLVAPPSLEGRRLDAPVVLVCTHGRRDACCARLGVPLVEALAPRLGAGLLWQASHLGGHRFAPNVVVLPEGVQLGRVPVERAEEVAVAIRERRIPLDLYRGRVLYPAHVQAAEVAVRVATACNRVDDVTLLEDAGERVSFATPHGERCARVERRDGPLVPASCGAEPEPTALWAAALESGG
jgi:hypothetical protein